jgi:hypothetical protein
MPGGQSDNSSWFHSMSPHMALFSLFVNKGFKNDKIVDGSIK